jgi:hypothetical protein
MVTLYSLRTVTLALSVSLLSQSSPVLAVAVRLTVKLDVMLSHTTTTAWSTGLAPVAAAATTKTAGPATAAETAVD